MWSHRSISDLLFVSPICLVDSLLALLALTAWWCHRVNCQQLALEFSRWPVLATGVVCQQTIRRNRRCRPSAIDEKLIYSDNHLLIWPFRNMHSLGGSCGDIHLGHFKKNINWIELNCYSFAFAKEVSKLAESASWVNRQQTDSCRVGTIPVISASWGWMHYDVTYIGARIRTHDLWIRKRVCYPLHQSAPRFCII